MKATRSEFLFKRACCLERVPSLTFLLNLYLCSFEGSRSRQIDVAREVLTERVVLYPLLVPDGCSRERRLALRQCAVALAGYMSR